MLDVAETTMYCICWFAPYLNIGGFDFLRNVPQKHGTSMQVRDSLDSQKQSGEPEIT